VSRTLSPLFRRVAIQQQQQRYYGSILLARPLAFSLLAAFFVLIAGLIIAFFATCGFTRSETVSGVLLPVQGLVRIYTPQPGTIVEKKVVEGQAVRAGDILFVLSNERASVAGEGTETAIGSLLESRKAKLADELEQHERMAKQQQAALDVRREQSRTQLAQLDSEIALQAKRAQMAETAAQRYADLHKSHYVSDAQAQDRLAEAVEQQARLRSLERSRSTMLSELAVLESERQGQPIKARREASSIERAIAELEQGAAENEARRHIVVRAARDGVVASIVGELGQFVSDATPLAFVVPPHSVLEAEIYAPSRAIGFVRPGTEVWIRYEAFPYQKFGQQRGVVRDISDTPVPVGSNGLVVERARAASEPVYRIRVALDAQAVKAYGRQQPLKAGMQMEASLALEKRRLIEWIIDPIYSVTGKL